MSGPRFDWETESLIREWREKYAGRRTVNYEMLTQAELLVRDAIARGLVEEAKARDWEREREVADLTRSLGTAERALAVQRDRVRDLEQHRRGITETHEAAEDGRIVRITQPTEPGYGRPNPRPWTLGEIEDLTYRLRVADARDGTSLKFKSEHVEAFVPHPEFALQPAQPAAPPATPRVAAVTPASVFDLAIWAPLRKIFRVLAQGMTLRNALLALVALITVLLVTGHIR